MQYGICAVFLIITGLIYLAGRKNRAVARLNTLSEYCVPFVKIGGRFIAYKGSAEEELREAENAFRVLGVKTVACERYDLPEEMGKRTLIVAEKIFSTPAAYPRGNGKERGKPL